MWFGVKGLGFRVQGSGFRVQGSGFMVWGLGFGVYVQGFRGGDEGVYIYIYIYICIYIYIYLYIYGCREYAGGEKGPVEQRDQHRCRKRNLTGQAGHHVE